MFNSDLKKIIKDSLEAALKVASLREALEIVSESVIEYYPDKKIWFTKCFGKREEFIAGAGKDSFLPPEKIQLTDKYSVFLQNFSDLSYEEKETIISGCKLLINSF
ncbi:MAG TPA: hypothetical protein GXZ31_06545 [Thermoanaerobacterales bacterium]|nr:hypothetical protein [Thermoanaerobacterales bacterium]